MSRRTDNQKQWRRDTQMLIDYCDEQINDNQTSDKRFYWGSVAIVSLGGVITALCFILEIGKLPDLMKLVQPFLRFQ